MNPYLLAGYTAAQGLQAHRCTLHISPGDVVPLLRLMVFAHPDVPLLFDLVAWAVVSHSNS